jgi:hypothetical protein
MDWKSGELGSTPVNVRDVFSLHSLLTGPEARKCARTSCAFSLMFFCQVSSLLMVMAMQFRAVMIVMRRECGTAHICVMRERSRALATV